MFAERVYAGFLLLVGSFTVASHAEISFFSPVTELEAGTSTVIPIQLNQEFDEDQSWEVTSSHENIIQVLTPATATAGYNLGYVRLQALQPGTATIRIGKGPVLKVKVQKSEQLSDGLIWTGPIDGSVIYGPCKIGLVMTLKSHRNDFWKTHPPTIKRSDGTEIAPSKIIDELLPVQVEYIYDLNSRDRESGWETLTVTRGNQVKKAAGTRRFIFINPDQVKPSYAYQSEDLDEPLFQPQEDEKAWPLPKVITSKLDPNLTFTKHYGNRNVISASLPLKEEANYQMLARVRGKRAASAFATVGLYLGKDDSPISHTRLVTEDWHWLPIGRPIELNPENRLVTLSMLNAFGRKTEKRILEIDKIRLVKLPEKLITYDKRALTLNVAMDTLFDKEPITGPLRIHGRVHYDGIEKKNDPVPKTQLLVNGKPYQTRYSVVPEFLLDPSALEKGTNEIQLQTSLFGKTVTTERQRLELTHRIRQSDPPKSEHLFSMRDPDWENIDQKHYSAKNRRKGDFVYRLSEGNTLRLNPPAECNGEFDVLLITGPGKPKHDLKLTHGTLRDGEVHHSETFEVKTRTWQSEIQVSSVEFEKEQDSFFELKLDGGKEPIDIIGLRLVAHERKEDKEEPEAKLLYPESGQEVWQNDLLVLDAFDPSGIDNVNVLVDGEPIQPAFRPLQQFGKIAVPISLQHLDSGSERFTVQVTDRHGNHETLSPIKLKILKDKPKNPTPYQRAVHLLNRVAYGPEISQLAKILTTSEEEWLRGQSTRGTMSRGESLAWKASELEVLPVNAYLVSKRTLDYAARTPNPTRARFTFWVQNHFSTWIRKAGFDEKNSESENFFFKGFSHFNDLLNLSARSPAMLVYLDQQRSFANKINENYAREIMELHTLGVDGRYQQADVTQLANILTGWSASREGRREGYGGRRLVNEFRFNHSFTDPSETEVIGIKLSKAETRFERFDRIEMMMEALSRHPDTARFISTKLAEYYVASPAPDALVEALEKTFHLTGGDMSKLMMTMTSHPQFWEQINEPRFMNPQDYSLRLFRNFQITNRPDLLTSFLKRSGMPLYERTTPDGYPAEPQAFADSNGFLQRWQLTQQLKWPLYQYVTKCWKPNQDWNENKDFLANAVNTTLTGFSFSGSEHEILNRVIQEEKNQKASLQDVAALVLQLPPGHAN